MNSILQLPLPKNQKQFKLNEPLPGSSLYLAISALDTPGLKLVVTSNLQEAHQAQAELQFFEPKARIALFPDWEVLPYDHFSPHEDLVSQRLKLLYELKLARYDTLIVCVTTLMHRLPPTDYILNATWQLNIGDSLTIDGFTQQMIQAGYQRTEQVDLHGAFTVRGSIIDVFPMGSPVPYRIELFDEAIESLRTFNPETQCTIEKIESINLLPGREFPLTESAIQLFRQQWRAAFAGNPKEATTYLQISKGHTTAGIEFYFPLFFHKTQTLFDYLPENTTILLLKNEIDEARAFQKAVQNRYEQYRHDVTRPLLPPTQLYLTPESVFQEMQAFQSIQFNSAKPLSTPPIVTPLPNLTADNQAKRPFARLAELIQSSETPTLLCAESPGREAVLQELLGQHDITPLPVRTWAKATQFPAAVCLCTAPLASGFIISGTLAVITEAELFGTPIRQQRRRSKTTQDPNTLFKNLVELNIGSPVVHIQHGVGRYLGLTTLTTGDLTAEYLTLEYANQDKVYVPVASLQLISRYSGGDADTAPLHRLGSAQWRKAKDNAQKRVRDVAAELLQIYSVRANSEGFSFSVPDAHFNQFRREFAFEETPDQTAAIDTVIQDMTAPTSMDRLICGDVGFGKTEVAMQAAFIAVNSGKQVAVLVPTTLLANQHQQNFLDRFANWPVKIGVLSRMQSKSNQTHTLSLCQSGGMDIVIGTHKLLQSSVQFKQLGLLIVDEEQRFGVRDKERIKALRANIDILTLTATPIPRTLNMALSSTRDLSIIATPPQRRLSIKTFVYPRSSSIIKEAVTREVMRGGQIYFLHNDIKSMPAQLKELQDLFPHLDIRIAHGQMREKELEAVMSDFYHRKFDLLIASTIIESGIDIPTANTILINRADKLGLAQLHQIRGRVGRSHHQAYAYLLTPVEGTVTKDAEKRLEAIQSLEDLGSGFLLATHDLEIRGAGELLGAEQSGQIHAVGFSMYMDMLEQAVQSLKKGVEPNYEHMQTTQTEVDLGVSTLFPEDYIGDVNIRLSLYKRLAGCQTHDEITQFKVEIIDRFGAIPLPAQHLLCATQIRIDAEAAGIKKCEFRPNSIKLQFSATPNIDPGKLIQLIQQKPHQFTLKNHTDLHIQHTESDPVQQRARFVETLQQLQPSTAAPSESNQ